MDVPSSFVRRRVARPRARRDRHRAARGPRRSTAPRSTPISRAGRRATAARRASRSSRTRSTCSRASGTAGRSGTPLALVVWNRDHKNWTWGMSPWPPEGEPTGKGTKPVTLPRPGHADLAGVQKFGHDDVRNSLERASARHTAVHVAAGAVAKALLAEIGIAVNGATVDEDGLRARIDEARRRARHRRRRRRGARRRVCHPGSARTPRRRTASTHASRRR